MSLESANLSPEICWQVSYPIVPRLFRELALEKKMKRLCWKLAQRHPERDGWHPLLLQHWDPITPFLYCFLFLQESWPRLAASSKMTGQLSMAAGQSRHEPGCVCCAEAPLAQPGLAGKPLLEGSRSERGRAHPVGSGFTSEPTQLLPA